MIKSLQENKELHKILETYTYQDYQDTVTNWLTSGQCVWYIYGNYCHKGAIQLVTEMRNMFNLKNILVKDLPPVITAQPKKGIAYCIEDPLLDPSNDNSAVLTQFEAAGVLSGDVKGYLLTLLVMNYIKAPYFDDLRTH